MASATNQAVLVQEQPGLARLSEQDGVYIVTGGDGGVLFEGDEIAAEFAYWRTTLGVENDSEVAE